MSRSTMSSWTSSTAPWSTIAKRWIRWKESCNNLTYWRKRQKRLERELTRRRVIKLSWMRRSKINGLSTQESPIFPTNLKKGHIPIICYQVFTRVKSPSAIKRTWIRFFYCKKNMLNIKISWLMKSNRTVISRNRYKS